jgi:hypothetical protein
MPSTGGFQLVAGRIPGERIATSTITSDSSTFTTSEVQVATVTAPLVTGRLYKVVFNGAYEITADGVLRSSIRENNTSGTVVQLRDISIDNSGSATGAYVEGYYTAVSTADKTFVTTGDVLVGGGTANLNASATFPAYMYVEYISG